MSKLILTGPDDLSQQGFTIEPEETLLNSELYGEMRTVLTKWIEAIPEITLRTPWEYQQRYAAMGACRERNLFAHEQGLGKTYETILMILLIFGPALFGMRHKPLRRGTIQIVAPRHTLRLAWLKEFKTCGLDEFVQVVTSEKELDRATAPIWLLHYDLLKQQSRHGRNLSKRGKTRTKRQQGKPPEEYFLGHPMWKKVRRVAKPHFVIFDEIHMLRKDSERTEAITQYVRGVKRRLGLTGTPIDGWVSHLATILKVIYGANNPQFPWDERSFTKRFTRERIVDMDYVTGDTGTGAGKKRAAPGINPDQIPEFWAATKHLMHRLVFRDPEVSPFVKFPPVEYHLTRCQMDMAHNQYYMQLHLEIVRQIEDAVKQIAAGSTNATRLRQNVLTNIQLLRRAASAPWSMGFPFNAYPSHDISKVRETERICLAAKAEGRKVIVFTNFVDTGRVIVQRLKEAGLSVTRIYAEDKQERPVSLTQEMREERIEHFLSEDGPDVLVGNLVLLSTGLTMVQASVVVNYDHDWRANTYKQGISRIVRPGQVWPHVDVHDLVTANSVDIYVFNALMQKVKATAELIDHQFSLADNTPGLDVDPLAVAKALIAGDLAIA